MRKYLITMACGAGLLVAGPGAALDLDEDLGVLLRAHRAFPHLIAHATAQGHSVEMTLKQRRALLNQLALSDAPVREVRGLRTISVESKPGSNVRSGLDAAAALDQLRTKLEPLVAKFDLAPAARRPRVVEAIHAGLARGEVARDQLTDLVRFAVWSIDVTDVRRRFTDLNSRDLEIFSSRHALKIRLGLLKRELGGSRRRHRALVNRLSQLQKDLAISLLDPPAPSAGRLTLHELPPDLGIFKSALGQDCSTAYCFGVPFAPSERIFAILDERDRTRGYVGLTQTRVHDQGAYYVNTINGPRLNAEHTRMVVAGLSALLDQNVTRLTLPTPSGLKGAMNYEVVRGVLLDLTLDQPDVAQRFTDVASRQIIDRQAQSDYEKMGPNAAARVIPRARLNELDYAVTSREGSRFGADAIPGEDVEREFTGVMLEAVAAHARGLVAFSAHRAHRSIDTFARIGAVILNERREPTEVYVARFASMLAGLAIPDPADYLKTHPHLLRSGLIVAEGQMEGERRDATIAALLKLLGDRRTWPDWLTLPLWLKRLAPDAKRDLVAATVRKLYAASARQKASVDLYQSTAETQYTRLLSMVTTVDELERDVFGRGDQNLHWGELIESVIRLSCFEHRSAVVIVDRRASEFARRVVLAAPDAAEMSRRVRQMLSAPSAHGLITELCRWIEAFVDLAPTAADVARFASATSDPALMNAVIGWRLAPKREGNLEASFRAHFPQPLPDHSRPFVARFLVPHLDDLFRELPGAAARGRFAADFMVADAAETQDFLHRSLLNMTDLRDVVQLFPDDAETSLESRLPELIRYLAPRFAQMSAADRATLREFFTTRLRDLLPLLEREVGFAAAPTAAAFLRVLERWPLDVAEFRRRAGTSRGYLTERQIERFVELKPTLEEYRDFLRLSVEARENVRLAAPLVDPESRFEWTAPVKTRDGLTTIHLDELLHHCEALMTADKQT